MREVNKGGRRTKEGGEQRTVGQSVGRCEQRGLNSRCMKEPQLWVMPLVVTSTRDRRAEAGDEKQSTRMSCAMCTSPLTIRGARAPDARIVS